jgi:superoxide reductase
MMAKKGQVFKCDKCGNIAAILQGGAGELVCCGETMREVTPNEAKSLSFDLSRPGAP